MTSASSSVAQIPFQFENNQQHDLDTFLQGENKTLLHLLKSIASNEKLTLSISLGGAGNRVRHTFCKQFVNKQVNQTYMLPISR